MSIGLFKSSFLNESKLNEGSGAAKMSKARKNFDAESYIEEKSDETEIVNEIKAICKILGESPKNVFCIDEYADESGAEEIYEKLVDEYVYIDEKVDMDGFFNMNKANDKRKATAMFIVNLMKLNAVDQIVIIEIINTLFNRILSNMHTVEKSKEIDEITENLYILVSNSKRILEPMEEWNTRILPIIQLLTNPNTKRDNAGITSRAAFKYMDM